MKINVCNISYKVKGAEILNNISFSLDKNELIGIIGANGSGKTTLLKHIYRNIKTENKIFIDNKDISTYTQKEYAKILSVMNQEAKEVDNMLTVYDIVLMSRYSYTSLFSYYRKEDIKKVDDILSTIGLMEFKNRKFATLSGGEKQRTLLARSLSQETGILILDEPTNHLDIKYKIELMERIKKYQGLSIMTLHDLNLAAKYCDRIIALKDGKIILDDVAKNIFTKKNLKLIYDVDFKIVQDENIGVYY